MIARTGPSAAPATAAGAPTTATPQAAPPGAGGPQPSPSPQGAGYPAPPARPTPAGRDRGVPSAAPSDVPGSPGGTPSSGGRRRPSAVRLRRRPGAPAGGAAGPTTAAGRRPRRTRFRSPPTPVLLWAGMAFAVLPVLLFTVAVQLGVNRNNTTVRTIGVEATEGITVAQSIALNIAELDEIAARNLLEPTELAESGYPIEYDDKRAELHANLVAAASESSADRAGFRQPLANVEYVVGHYHALVADAFAAVDRGDNAGAAILYSRAHGVAEASLLPEADFVDKANTYVLNDTYDAQASQSQSTFRLVLAAWLVLLAFLVAVQVAMARKFRRLVNPALALATLITLVTGGFTLYQLDNSAEDIVAAREQAFDSVHVLARARTTLVAARQSEAHLLFDPSPGNHDAAFANFQGRTSELFRVPGGGGAEAAEIARSGAAPGGSGGYLATVAAAAEGAERDGAIRRALVGFGDYVVASRDMRAHQTNGDPGAARAVFRSGVAYTELAEAIDEAQETNQAAFDDLAGAARDATGGLGAASAVAAGAVLGLFVLGLYQRQREYRG